MSICPSHPSNPIRQFYPQKCGSKPPKSQFFPIILLKVQSRPLVRPHTNIRLSELTPLFGVLFQQLPYDLIVINAKVPTVFCQNIPK